MSEGQGSVLDVQGEGDYAHTHTHTCLQQAAVGQTNIKPLVPVSPCKSLSKGLNHSACLDGLGVSLVCL